MRRPEYGDELVYDDGMRIEDRPERPGREPEREPEPEYDSYDDFPPFPTPASGDPSK